MSALRDHCQVRFYDQRRSEEAAAAAAAVGSLRRIGAGRGPLGKHVRVCSGDV